MNYLCIKEHQLFHLFRILIENINCFVSNSGNGIFLSAVLPVNRIDE